jgi:hypothetical protein
MEMKRSLARCESRWRVERGNSSERRLAALADQQVSEDGLPADAVRVPPEGHLFSFYQKWRQEVSLYIRAAA